MARRKTAQGATSSSAAAAPAAPAGADQQPPAQQQQRLQQPGVRAALAVGALLAAAAAVLLYSTAPRLPLEAADELHLLHEDPSPHSCAAPQPLVCSHGGDITAAPANTLEAYAAALDDGVRCLEVDVARTSDGVLVSLHTRELAHLLRLAGGAAAAAADAIVAAGGRPQVGDFTWAQLSALRWEGGQPVARADVVLALAAPRTDHVTLDVKPYVDRAGREAGLLELAAALLDLDDGAQCSQCLVWCSSDELVALVKRLRPTLQVGYVVADDGPAARAAGRHRLLRRQVAQAEVVALHHALASPHIVQAAVAAGKRVHAFTANTAAMMRAVLDAGVHAVLTNHHRQLSTAIERRARRCRQRQRQGGPQEEEAGEQQQQQQKAQTQQRPAQTQQRQQQHEQQDEREL